MDKMRVNFEAASRELTIHVEAVIAAVASGDYEAAHQHEDELHRKALKAIAEGAPNAKMIASLALDTERLIFARVCA